MQYEVGKLRAGLPVILSPLTDIPRSALALTFRGGVSRETLPATAKLAGRLLLKGTSQRSAEDIARELDARAIEFREITLADCSLLLAVFLNRELPAVLELLEDIVFHSTFADFEKETEKLSGEIQASLDQPRDVAHDLLTRTLFAGSPYGHTGTRMLETLNELTPEQVKEWYVAGLDPRQMNLTLVGDFSPADVTPRLNAAFGALGEQLPPLPQPTISLIEENQLVTRARPDAQQAQIYQGWYAPTVGSATQAATAVMNTILGGAGLSSRLHTELREKQGLAYAVHSQYVPMRLAGQFLIYIGTSPENIDRAREGFAAQIARLQHEPITLEELRFAKGRLRGSYVLAHETTSQRCLDMAISQANGFAPDYSEQFLRRVEQVTVADVQSAAQQIVAPSVTAIVASEEVIAGIVSG